MSAEGGVCAARVSPGINARGSTRSEAMVSHVTKARRRTELLGCNGFKTTSEWPRVPSRIGAASFYPRTDSIEDIKPIFLGAVKHLGPGTPGENSWCGQGRTIDLHGA